MNDMIPLLGLTLLSQRVIQMFPHGGLETRSGPKTDDGLKWTATFDYVSVRDGVQATIPMAGRFEFLLKDDGTFTASATWAPMNHKELEGDLRYDQGLQPLADALLALHAEVSATLNKILGH